MNNRFWTADREAGNKIEDFATREEAEAAIERYEATDEEEGTYTPDFYEVEEEEEDDDYEADNARRAAFTAAANDYYLEHTEKTYEQLDKEGYYSYGKNSWADGLNGDEWETIDDAKDAGIETAIQCLEREEEEKQQAREED